MRAQLILIQEKIFNAQEHLMTKQDELQEALLDRRYQSLALQATKICW